jgi:hypothetical protein
MMCAQGELLGYSNLLMQGHSLQEFTGVNNVYRQKLVTSTVLH